MSDFENCQNAKLSAFLDKIFSCIYFQKSTVIQMTFFWESSCSIGNLYSRVYFTFFFCSFNVHHALKSFANPVFIDHNYFLWANNIFIFVTECFFCSDQ